VRTTLESGGVIVQVDARKEFTPGWKFNEWELRGVPLRIEIGPRDLRAKQVVLVRRDTGERLAVPRHDVLAQTEETLEEIQKNLAARADAAFKDRIQVARDYEELKRILNDEGGFVRVDWCGRVECADEIQEETNGGVIRGTLVGKDEKPGPNCIHCGKPATQVVYISKQY